MWVLRNERWMKKVRGGGGGDREEEDRKAWFPWMGV